MNIGNNQKRTQRDAVIDYVEKHGSITSLEAIRHLGITRLAAVVNAMNGTEHALKGVEAPDMKGFVRYVPDEQARVISQRGKIIDAVYSSRSIDQCIHNVLNVCEALAKSRRYERTGS